VQVPLELPYSDDSACLFAPLARQPWALWLDSGWPGSQSGRHDIITALPRTTLVTRGEETRIEHQDGRVDLSGDDPFELLRAQLGPQRPVAPAPFVGGALGYFAYDLARRRRHLDCRARDGEGLPEMALGIYDGALVIDHHERTCRLWAGDDDAGRDWAERFLASLHAAPATGTFTLAGAITASPGPEAYLRAFNRIKDYIQAGDCYQVNLALRFTAPCQGHPWPLYLALRRHNPAPFSAWLNFPFGQVLSSSPERFLSVRGDQVETCPIKGTRPRSTDPDEDARRRVALSGSEKDRAENLMIVDLLRNDLGQVCVPGSVSVPSLFSVASFATVHHLVSTVRGRLRPGLTALDQLVAAFPGGSITGAPKLRAMQIIEELEAERRGVYCGAIGYLGFDGGMDTNIAIRTLTCRENRLRYAAGGGLVADSEAAAEYRECQDKARAPLDVLARFQAPP
jgi:para-aminobenzoate synthetase component I